MSLKKQNQPAFLWDTRLLAHLQRDGGDDLKNLRQLAIDVPKKGPVAEVFQHDPFHPEKARDL